MATTVIVTASTTIGFSGSLPNAVAVGEGQFEPDLTYKMRGYDETIEKYVYWTSLNPGPDMLAEGYAGPGPVLQVTVNELLP